MESTGGWEGKSICSDEEKVIKLLLLPHYYILKHSFGTFPLNYIWCFLLLCSSNHKEICMYSNQCYVQHHFSILFFPNFIKIKLLAMMNTFRENHCEM